MWWASTTEPSVGPSCSLKYLLKWSCHIRLTRLLESNSEGTDLPIILSSELGHLATAHFMILNQVCIDLVSTCGPISTLSKSGKGKPFTFSPLIRFLINGDWGLMTPQSQPLAWLCIHGLIYVVASYNFLIHDQYLCNTSMSKCCPGTHLSA